MYWRRGSGCWDGLLTECMVHYNQTGFICIYVCTWYPKQPFLKWMEHVETRRFFIWFSMFQWSNWNGQASLNSWMFRDPGIYSIYIYIIYIYTQHLPLRGALHGSVTTGVNHHHLLGFKDGTPLEASDMQRVFRFDMIWRPKKDPQDPQSDNLSEM